MHVLVTGGAGYIGSVTCEVLQEHRHTVCVVDDLSRGHRAAIPPGVPLEVCSILDAERMRAILERERPDGVLHFAASSLVGESMRDPGLYFRNNVGGMVSLLDACVEAGCRRVLLSSSAATYGDPDEVPIPEEAPTRPTNPYGESKRICEQMLEWYRRVHGIRYGSLRYFNAAGASVERGEDHEPETHLIPLALQAALGSGNALRVFGTDYQTEDGTCVRDYIHVVDLAEAHLLTLEKLQATERLVLNLGNGSGFSVLEVIRAVEAVTGRTVPWSAAPRREGDPPRLVASSARAREVLGWRPQFDSLERIVQTAADWMQEHPRGYEREPTG
ncbi:MAG: UDP-glucose 4-epimerase GalE [Candidatus Eisenbacteria bacterium]|nr:UDP-glucose 4-epimerase GalE [Candidatus Latescibacterota bacterium]MBD3303200.1 UDP-glucose 4-epimerase GalE [Candidatus Eisenbacteria bacterium]